MKVLLGKIYSYFSLEAIFLYDYFRFKKYFVTEKKRVKTRNNLKALIFMDKHKVEKALSLPEVRLGFGEDLIKRLYRNLVEYKDKYGEDRCYYYGVGALILYVKVHSEKKYDVVFLNELDLTFLNDNKNDKNITNQVGVSKFNDIDILDFDYLNFVSSRHSCRNYTSELISKSILNDAVRAAIKTPSVCNRQHWNCHIFQGESIKNLLHLQTGNRGFDATISNLAVITADLSAFYLPSERQQPFVDGGMFAMSFINALHAKGIKSCALNWSAFIGADMKVHKFIPDNESVIMFISFGYSSSDAVYANSPRKDVCETIYFH